MKKNKKNKLYVILFALIISLCACNSVPNPDELKCSEIKKIQLISKGFEGLASSNMTFQSQEFIEPFCSIIKNSKLCKTDVNEKANKGLLIIRIFRSNGKSFGYLLVDTTFDGFILSKENRLFTSHWRN